MILRRDLPTCISFIFLTVAAASSSAAQQDCAVPDWDLDVWRAQYAAAIPACQMLHEEEQNASFFQALLTMPENQPVTILQWDESGTQQSEHTIENPVLLTSWVSSPIDSGGAENHVAWQEFKLLQRYTCNPYDDTGGNIWFTINGEASDFIAEQFPDQINCMDPRIGEQCQNAISIGVPTVGLPYGFSNPDEPDPIAPWWAEFLVLAIADRDSMIRPSFNPTVRPNSKDHPTHSGTPVWDADASTYRFANPETEPALFAEQFEATKSFIGYNTSASPPVIYTGWEGFQTCLELWSNSSWNNSDPWFRFPYTELGRTWYWQNNGIDGTKQGQPALSEFVLMGDQPIWIIGTWQGAGYLFSNPEGDPGVAPWCQRCPGDINIDGRVDGEDLGMMLSNWGSSDNPCMNLTKNDSYVGSDDLSFLLSHWTGPEGCPGWPESLASLKPSDQPCP